LAALAVSLNAVGVDIEFDHGVSLQCASLSLEEHQVMLRLDPADRPGAFLRLWAAKEAVPEVVGRGLGDDPASIDVTSCCTGRPLSWTPQRWTAWGGGTSGRSRSTTGHRRWWWLSPTFRVLR
jgi:phosphopantetheinyl transferase